MEELDEDTRKQREALIIGQFGGIYPVNEAFYIHSIIYAAERSESAFQRFEDVVAKAESAALAVATVQEALTHAGALSRFFWPVKKDGQLAAARGKRLREAFALDDKSALKWRKLQTLSSISTRTLIASSSATELATSSPVRSWTTIRSPTKPSVTSLSWSIPSTALRVAWREV